MTVVNPKSISGINSITTGSGSDNLLTIHTSDASNTERFRIDSTGTTKIVTGIVTTLTSNTTTLNSTTTATGNINISGANITLQDSGGASDDRLTFGAGTDLSIYHNGSDSYIEDSGTGALVLKTSQLSIRNAADDEQLAKFIQDSSVELYHNNSKKLETTSSGITVTGAVNTSSVTLGDDNKAFFGTGSDLSIYHDGSNSYILNTTNNLIIKDLTDAVYIQAPQIVFNDETTNENIAKFISDGAVELYHNNVKKFETHDVGTIFTEAGSGTTQAAIKVNTTLDTYGSVTVRDKRDVDNAVAAFQVENASNGSNETNLLLRSVNLGSSAFSHGLYAAKSHRFAVSSNVTPTVQIDSDGLKFNNDQASANALDDYEEGTWTPTVNGTNSNLTHRASRYIKIGKLVQLQVEFYTSAGNFSTGANLNLTNLPFQGPPSPMHVVGSVSYMNSAYGMTLMTNYMNASSQWYFSQSTGSGLYLWGNITYETAS